MWMYRIVCLAIQLQSPYSSLYIYATHNKTIVLTKNPDKGRLAVMYKKLKTQTHVLLLS